MLAVRAENGRVGTSALGDHKDVVGVFRGPGDLVQVDPRSIFESQFLRLGPEYWMPRRKMECRAYGVLQRKDSENTCVRKTISRE